MRVVADFHIHSKYSRATSKNMDVENISRWARIKGIDIVGTGDFTHPEWLKELKDHLKEDGEGLYIYNGVHFVLSSEISLVFAQGGKTRKVHICLISPSFREVEKINNEFGKFGDLSIDGRPTLPLSCKELVRLVKDVSPDTFIFPAHAWTPWFGIFGSMTGFDSIEEAFGEEAKHIYALETGLSSDPPMNWMVSSLDRFSLVSNSDAHSPSHLGREANVFDIEFNFYEMVEAIKKKDKNKFLFTIEFFPEEGKYHYDGHRKCGVSMSPKEAKERKNICPVCGRPMTLGVLHRVYDLSDREEGFSSERFIPFKRLVPLQEIIAQAMEKGVATKGVQDEYMKLIQIFGTEFNVLLFTPLSELEKRMNKKIFSAIKNMREGKVKIKPGFDGEYGKVLVEIDKDEEKPPSLFG